MALAYLLAFHRYCHFRGPSLASAKAATKGRIERGTDDGYSSGDNGRLILPLSVRKAMGLHGEGKVILTLENDEVRLSPIVHGVSRARELYRQHVKAERATAEFLTDRAEEVAQDASRAEG